MQNLRNFLISFCIGLVVFGICAVLLIHFGTKKITDNDGTDIPETSDAADSESNSSEDIEYSFDDSNYSQGTSDSAQ